PPASALSGEGQTNALAALVAAIPLRDEASPAPTLTGGGLPTATATSINDKNPTNVKAIAGGVTGGVVFLALLVGLVVIVLGRRKRLQTLASVEDGDEDGTASDRIHPFTAPISEKASVDQQRKGQKMLPFNQLRTHRASGQFLAYQ
ncbi:hypothetical protein MPER_15632, partial [Moniliophthora perniciosa FA553]